MKQLRFVTPWLAALAGFASVLAPLSGQEIRGWYEAGGTVMPSANVKSFLFEPVSELESGFHYNSIRSISGADTVDAQLYQVPILGNVVLQFPNRTRFVPVIGAGAGAISALLDADNLTLGTSTFAGDEQTWTFAYQGYAGVQYHFADDLGVGLFYHYMVSDAPSWGDGPDGVIKFNRLQSHSLALTLNFRF